MHKWFGDKPFLTASAFSTMCFLDRWARGMGWHWRDWVERFIERKQLQGVKAIRVFDETSDWTGTKGFFTVDRATSRLMWDYNQLRQQARPHRLTPHHQVMLLELIGLARSTGMKVELPVDATLKHSPSVGWLVIGHCIRQVADFLKGVDRGTWVDVNEQPEGGMGNRHDPESHERIRAKFEAVKGPLTELVAVETHNEADAHSHLSWRTVPEWNNLPENQLKQKAFGEVNQQLSRMRTESHWPGCAVWVSEGGDDGQGSELFSYDFRRADAIAVHPSRPSMDIGGRFDDMIRQSQQHGIPIYANEPIHYIDPAYWWTVEKEWFRLGSSTQDAVKRWGFVQGMLERGFWVCDHSLVGMANGMLLVDGEWHEMPLDRFEQILLGDGAPPPGPPPPPPPAPKTHLYERVIRLAYQQILGRDPDPSGLEAYDDAMTNGMSESAMRESLLRSPEYEGANRRG